VGALAYPDPRLSDGSISLRPWSEADLPAIVAACQDPLIQRFIIDVPSPYSEADARAFLTSREPTRTEGLGLDLAIVDSEDRVLGAVGMRLVAATRSANVGYWLAPAARGRGAASRALGVMCGWLFDVCHVGRIELTADPLNVASQRVATRCGFRPEGYLRRNARFRQTGRRRDSVLFSLLPEDLRASRGPRRRIIWINGTFGAGKTSTATELKLRHPELVVLDPEHIGFVLRQIIPVPTGDFQDLPEWREVVAATGLALTRHRSGPVLAPMTLLRRDYLQEIFCALRAGGAEVFHVLIDAPDAVLRARIDLDSSVPDQAVGFRRDKLADYGSAREWLSDCADLVIRSGDLSVAEVADQVESLW
jgi:RimJ/RimL family protein N-acetyltransferase